MIGWIFFGLIVGVLAKLVMPGCDPGGIILTSLLGIAGAVIGGFWDVVSDGMALRTRLDS